MLEIFGANMSFVQDMLDHAQKDHPFEACGLVVASNGKYRLIAAKNVHPSPKQEFQIDEAAWLEVQEDEEVIGIYHSHPEGSSEPSWADRSMCEATGLTWHIVSYPQCGYTSIQPDGFQAPYLCRPYVHGVHDCYSIIRDWYEREWDLKLPEFDREDEWWDKGQNLYLDNFESCGFITLPENSSAEIGDAFLIQIGQTKTKGVCPNHAAIYIGDGKILHHPRGRLSTEDPYGGMWSRFTIFHLRHNSRMIHG